MSVSTQVKSTPGVSEVESSTSTWCTESPLHAPRKATTKRMEASAPEALYCEVRFISLSHTVASAIAGAGSKDSIFACWDEPEEHPLSLVVVAAEHA